MAATVSDGRLQDFEILNVRKIIFVYILKNCQHGICAQHWTLCPYCTGIDLEASGFLPLSSESESESNEDENRGEEIRK
ncbi:unnamed protein product [Caenorhabditis nigoni]